jgi:hypothetical protein
MEFVIILCQEKSFYAFNDMTLNVKKLCKFMPEYERVRKDKSYTHEEISLMLEIVPNFQELFYILYQQLEHYSVCNHYWIMMLHNPPRLAEWKEYTDSHHVRLPYL